MSADDLTTAPEGADAPASAEVSDDLRLARCPDDLRLTRCPVCRRALVVGERECGRCGSDLGLVHAALAGAWQDVLRAREASAAGDHATALAAAWRAVSLARTVTTEALWERLAPD